MAEVNLPILIGAAAIDAINPCAFGVLIFLCTYLLKTAKKPGLLLRNGLIYILAVFLTYMAAGLLLLDVIQKLGTASVWTYVIIGILVIIAGLIEVKDYFFYGKWFSLTIFPSEAQRIKEYAAHFGSTWYAAFGLGVFVALVELPCTGAVYLAILAMMSAAGATFGNVTMLILYNIIFVLPLFVILYLFSIGVKSDKFEEFREKHKGLMRLLTGLLLIIMGAWMLLSVAPA